MSSIHNTDLSTKIAWANIIRIYINILDVRPSNDHVFHPRALMSPNRN
ncbi:12109_t:CDS:1, partial [Dentiscutata heterogama]